MSMSPEAAEQKGISVCEKQTKDGRIIAYKTSQQLTKEKESKTLSKEARQKAGLKSRGRLSKTNKEKLSAIVDELKALRSERKMPINVSNLQKVSQIGSSAEERMKKAFLEEWAKLQAEKKAKDEPPKESEKKAKNEPSKKIESWVIRDDETRKEYEEDARINRALQIFNKKDMPYLLKDVVKGVVTNSGDFVYKVDRRFKPDSKEAIMSAIEKMRTDDWKTLEQSHFTNAAYIDNGYFTVADGPKYIGLLKENYRKFPNLSFESQINLSKIDVLKSEDVVGSDWEDIVKASAALLDKIHGSFKKTSDEKIRQIDLSKKYSPADNLAMLGIALENGFIPDKANLKKLGISFDIAKKNKQDIIAFSQKVIAEKKEKGRLIEKQEIDRLQRMQGKEKR